MLFRSFPKPPTTRSSVGAGSDRFGSVKSAAFVTAEDGGEPESENPFADFTEVASPPLSSPALSPALTKGASRPSTAGSNFAAVETIRRPFVPTMGDEMAVKPGDEVRIVQRFDDGWAVAENVATGAHGHIPIDCLRAPQEELPAFLAKKRISSYRASVATVTAGTGAASPARASTRVSGSTIGAAL